MNDAPTVDGSTYFELAQVLRVLRERKWIVVGMVVAAVLVSMVLSLRATPQYRATAGVLMQSTSLDKALFGAQIFQITDQQRALKTAADLVKLDTVAARVKSELSSFRSVRSLQQMVSVTTAPAADIINVLAVSSDPSEAAAVANSFARQFILYRQESDRATLRQARSQLQTQYDAMTPTQQSSARGLTLSQKVEELGVLESMQTGGFELVQKAVVPGSPFSPDVPRRAWVAAVLGLVLGLVAAFLLHALDRRMKDEDVVQRELGAAVIATVPLVKRRIHRGYENSTPLVDFKDPGSSVLEAFRTLRSNLKFFQVDREIRSLLVTSALPGEGKTTIAVNLALALAMSGKRVMLLEADLRRPMIDSYLDLSRGPGFTNLLAGTHDVGQVAQAVDLNAFLPPETLQAETRNGGSPSLAGGLLCITAGPLPPNPSELLATDRASEVLQELNGLCDYLVIDAPPLLLVSDGVELAKKADGTLIAVRLRSTTIEEARRTKENLTRVGVVPLGAVVLGARRARSYYRRYGGYYAKA